MWSSPFSTSLLLHLLLHLLHLLSLSSLSLPLFLTSSFQLSLSSLPLSILSSLFPLGHLLHIYSPPFPFSPLFIPPPPPPPPPLFPSSHAGDEIRRVVVETVVPLAQQFLVGRVKHKMGKAGHIPDTILAEYDQFDDYLEMVIQFGVSALRFSLLPQPPCLPSLLLLSSHPLPLLPPSLPPLPPIPSSTSPCLHPPSHWELP